MYSNLVLVLCVKTILCANILYLSSIPSPSHYIWNRALAYGLVQKGHNVTFVTPDNDESVKPSNYTHMLLKGLYEDFYADLVDNPNDMAENSPLKTLLDLKMFCELSCKHTLKNNVFREVLNYPSDFFDTIIFDVTGPVCFYPLIHWFKYPVTVGVTPFLLPSFVGYNFGNQASPAFVPWHSFPYSQSMSFEERVWNFVFTYVEIGLRNTFGFKAEHKMARETFGDNIPSLEELERHISLILANTDPVIEVSQPLAPNVIPVGGLHTRKSKNIPNDLKTILDGAVNGAIVFSLGTNVRSDKLDKGVQKLLLEAFSKIPETVVWKFESEIDNLPKNVIVRKWLPQNDLLGHPNVKLFIGHGGALSTQEAMFHGVPMICVPFFADQHLNTKKIVDRKLGIALDFANITKEEVYRSVREVLDNSVYSTNMRQVSERFRDRAETPLERGVFWVEYAMRHQGAHFLNTAARDLPFYQASGLDVTLFLLLTTMLVAFVIFKLLNVISRISKSKKKVKIN